MSRLWLTNWQTDRHGKVMQYSLGAECVIWAGRPSPIWAKPKRKGIFSATSSLLTSVKPSIIWRVLALLPAIFMYSIYCPPRCSALRKEGNCKAAQFPSFFPSFQINSLQLFKELSNSSLQCSGDSGILTFARFSCLRDYDFQLWGASAILVSALHSFLETAIWNNRNNRPGTKKYYYSCTWLKAVGGKSLTQKVCLGRQEDSIVSSDGQLWSTVLTRCNHIASGCINQMKDLGFCF